MQDTREIQVLEDEPIPAVGNSDDSASSARFSTRRIIRSALVFALAGVILYGAATIASDYRSTIGALSRFPLGKLALVLLLVVIGWLLRAWRFNYYLTRSGYRVNPMYAVKVFLASFALTGTPGKMGEAAKGIFLKEDYDIPVSRVLGILVVERLMDLWGVLLLGCFSLLLFDQWRGLFLLCAGLVIAGGAFLCMEGLYRPILERTAQLRFLHWISQKALDVLVTGRELMTMRIFLIGLLMSTVAWGLESVSFYLILQGLDIQTSLLEANFVYSFSTLIGGLSMLPGGIGGTEASMLALLAFLSVPYAAGLPAVILVRLCTLWFAILVGICFMVSMLVKSKAAGASYAST